MPNKPAPTSVTSTATRLVMSNPALRIPNWSALPLGNATTNLTFAGLHFHQSALRLVVLPAGAELSLVCGPALRCTFVAASSNRTVPDAALTVGAPPLRLQLGASATCRDAA